jgi:hypothetical protein
MQSRKIKKGGHSKINRLQKWSYLPFLFCVIALQCINLELPPFLFCAIALQSIKLELPPFFIFDVIALQSIKLELPPFFILCDCNAIY